MERRCRAGHPSLGLGPQTGLWRLVLDLNSLWLAALDSMAGQCLGAVGPHRLTGWGEGNGWGG